MPLTLIASPSESDIEAGRDAAWLSVVRGYEEALGALDPSDVEKRAWVRERLRDARRAAGLPPVLGAVS
jgi:hypothetical protein